uniref:Uncharacterized protein n=1 Tax=Papilio polytes TaxID=76194 RepID=I4DSC3_PAPPL|nr:unknown unsecreted protein [Papilio polytes]
MAKRPLPIDIRNCRCVAYSYPTEEEMHIKRIFPLPMYLRLCQIHFPFPSSPYKKRVVKRKGLKLGLRHHTH